LIDVCIYYGNITGERINAGKWNTRAAIGTSESWFADTLIVYEHKIVETVA
jgi:hypothetical protein